MGSPGRPSRVASDGCRPQYSGKARPATHRHDRKRRLLHNRQRFKHSNSEHQCHCVPTTTTTATLISPGDTVLIGNETVRKVLSASNTTGQIVLNKPMANSGSTLSISMVTQIVGSADLCPNCAAAQQTTVVGTGNQLFTLNSFPILDSGGSAGPMNLANRFFNNGDTVVNPFDVSLVTVTGTAVATTIV